MVSKEFKEKLISLLTNKLGNPIIRVQDVTKNNGIHLTGLTIQEPESDTAPCVYLEGFYYDYEKKDRSIEDIAEEVLRLYHKYRTIPGFDISDFQEYTHASEKLCGKLINTEKNRELLESTPHRDFFDLSLIYYVEVMSFENERAKGSIRVQNEHLEMWGVTEDDLYDQVMENMETFDGACLRGIADVFTDMFKSFSEEAQQEEFLEETRNVPMYVLTNSCNVNGAVQILNKKTLDEAADLLGGDFFILPSSIHETILVPATQCGEHTPESLAQLVHDVNNSVLMEDEFLSSHVYRYFTETKQIQLVA